jgi:hypothetical protein
VSKRKSIGTKLRFEVFKRDSFTCQYCGGSAPDVILEIDHISPVSKGGDNDIMNLVTSCWGCNSGKGDRELDDDAVIEKQRAQLEELNERRLQLEMMLQWRDGLKSIEEQQCEAAAERFSNVSGYTLNRTGAKAIKSHVRKFGLTAVLDALDVAAERYLRYEDEQETRFTQESVEQMLSKVPGVCYIESRSETERQLYYARGILQKRIHIPAGWQAIKLLKLAAEAGALVDELQDIARSVNTWPQFKAALLEEWGVEL